MILVKASAIVIPLNLALIGQASELVAAVFPGAVPVSAIEHDVALGAFVVAVTKEERAEWADAVDPDILSFGHG
jgi:hypothetical protein